jgi:pimeloyl-ACP methyl ester carboxylesterase
MRALIHDFPWMPLPDAALRQLDERCLIVIGGRDRVVRHAARRVAQLTGPTVVVVEDAGHAVNEERPDVVNEVIVEFLRRRCL